MIARGVTDAGKLDILSMTRGEIEAEFERLGRGVSGRAGVAAAQV
jgi:hypothetical protein